MCWRGWLKFPRLFVKRYSSSSCDQYSTFRGFLASVDKLEDILHRGGVEALDEDGLVTGGVFEVTTLERARM